MEWARKPVNKDAAMVAKPFAEMLVDCSNESIEKIKWKGLISKCPSCGGRAYENGWCFGCGKPLARKLGISKHDSQTL